MLESDAEAGSQAQAALERAVAIGLADSSDRQRNLLRFLVHEETEGRGERLKAYSIATEVFGRPTNFDAQQDAIVRVEIGRLRKSLELYYATQGRSDPVRIVIDKGQYRPRFEGAAPPGAGPARESAPSRRRRRYVGAWIAGALAIVVLGAGAAGWALLGGRRVELRSSPRIAVAPFDFSADREGQAYLGAGLRAEIVSVLSEFEWLTVFPISRRVDLATTKPPGRWKIDYVLKANVQAVGDSVVVTPILLDASTGAVRWSARYSAPVKANEMLALERNVASRVAADVGQPFGVVANIEQTRAAMDSFDGDEAYRCHLRVVLFWSNYRREDFRAARECAEKLASLPTPGANVDAMRALLKLDGARLGYEQRRRSELLSEAAALASEAYRRNDKGALPRIARYSTALCQGDVALFRRVSQAIVRDYPNNPATLLDVGAKTALGADDWNSGLELVSRARDLSSHAPNWFEFADVIDALRSNIAPNAEGLHEAALDSSHPLLLVVDAALQGRLQNEEARRAALNALAGLGFDGPQALAELIERQCWSTNAKNALARRLTADAGR